MTNFWQESTGSSQSFLNAGLWDKTTFGKNSFLLTRCSVTNSRSGKYFLPAPKYLSYVVNPPPGSGAL